MTLVLECLGFEYVRPIYSTHYIFEYLCQQYYSYTILVIYVISGQKETVTVTVQLNDDYLLTVAWTVLSRRVADARAAATIHSIAGDVFVFQQDNAPAHRACDTVKLLFCAVRHPSSSVLTCGQPTVVT